jgi:hypothetical protein
MQFAAPQSSESKISDSKVNSALVNSRTISPTTAEPTLIAGPAPRDTVSVQPGSSDATVAAAQTASVPETGFAIANSFSNDNPSYNVSNDSNNEVSSLTANLVTSNVFTSNLAANPNSDAPTPASIAVTSDAASNAKPGVSVQAGSVAASQTTAADKKSLAAIQSNATRSSGTPSSATPTSAASLQTVPVVVASGRDASATLTAPAPPASAPVPQGSSAPAPVLPQAHQMLDSAPAPPTVPATPIAPGSAADLQMNGQMHVGVRTDAFGAVEIHTVVQQSQVGITVHADRDIARWFSSEVPGLESGLNNNHLNLTGVNFDHGRSGVQTATGFSQGQPRQSFSQTHGSQSAGLPGSASPEQANVDIATEFANLIVAQRSYEANARVVTTFDTIAQDTIALKQ